MPILPRNNKCATLGCVNTRAKLGSMCLDHGGKDVYRAKTSDERKAFNAMYDQPFWRKFRASQLSRQPLCEACLCQGRICSANHVDHLFSWSKLNKDAFFRNIFQSLCIEHHSEKTALEHKGIFRHYKDNKTSDYSLSDYSFVMTQTEYYLPTVARMQHNEET